MAVVIGSAASTLTLVGVAVATIQTAAQSVLSFTDSIVLQMVYTLSVESILSIHSFGIVEDADKIIIPSLGLSPQIMEVRETEVLTVTSTLTLTDVASIPQDSEESTLNFQGIAVCQL